MNIYEYPDFWFPGDVELEAYPDGGLHFYRHLDDAAPILKARTESNIQAVDLRLKLTQLVKDFFKGWSVRKEHRLHL